MALKFRKIQRKVLSGADQGKTKTYAMAQMSGYCDMEKLCKLISARCAMSSADVKAILDSLNWAMDLELQAGNIVQVGEFGNFRLSLSSEGVEESEDGKVKLTALNIKKARILFTPGKSLRATKADVSFQYDEPTVVEVECEKPHAI